MGTKRSRGGDLLAALITFSLVFGVTYIAGRAFMPSFRSGIAGLVAEAANGARPPSEAAPDSADSDSILLADLRVDLTSLGAPAVIDVAGAIDGRYVLEHADAPVVWVPLRGEAPEPGEGFPIDVDIRFSAADTTLTVVADQAEAGVPRSERLTVVLTTAGRSFVAHPGECSLELLRSGYSTQSNPYVGEIIVAFFTGQVLCRDVGDIRSGETVSFTAVFDYEAH
jgi:hypothetical protein